MTWAWPLGNIRGCQLSEGECEGPWMQARTSLPWCCDMFNASRLIAGIAAHTCMKRTGVVAVTTARASLAPHPRLPPSAAHG